jgi:hypothetical protein
MDAHPPGYLEYLDALGPRGKYGRWLRKRPVIVKVGETLFVHGGVNPDFQPTSVKRINDQAHLEIVALDRIREYLIRKRLILPFFSYSEIVNVLRLEAKRIRTRPDTEMLRFIDIFNGIAEGSLFHHDGPLWFRGLSDWSEEEGERRIEPILKAFGARRIVVGHVFAEDASHIRSRFGGKAYLIDTAMLRGYGINGRPSALEISGNDVTAIYETGRVGLEGAPKREGLRFLLRGPEGIALPFRTRGEVVGFMRDARLVKAKAGELHGLTKPTKVLVEHDGARAHAVFRSLHLEEPNASWEDGTFTELLRDTWKSEIAAYELSLLLGLDTVPPTVPWELHGRPGSLQIFIERAHKGWHPEEPEKPPDPSWWQMEVDRLRVFDALIRNTDRHVRNMLVDSNRVVWWIDHTRAFGREHDLLRPEEIRRCERQLWQRLQDLDPQLVATRMTPYMGPEEVAALLARQERLVALIRQRIRNKGEAAVLFTMEPQSPRRAQADATSSSDR